MFWLLIGAAAVALAGKAATPRPDVAAATKWGFVPPAEGAAVVMPPTLLQSPTRKFASAGTAFVEVPIATLRGPRLFKVHWRATAWQHHASGGVSTVCASGRVDLTWTGFALSASEGNNDGAVKGDTCAGAKAEAQSSVFASGGRAVLSVRLEVAGSWAWTLTTRTVNRVD